MKNIFLCIKMLCYFCVSENIQLSVHTNYMKYNDQQVYFSDLIISNRGSIPIENLGESVYTFFLNCDECVLNVN